jgi:hypothetical protein
LGSTRCRIALEMKNTNENAATIASTKCVSPARRRSDRPVAIASKTNKIGEASPAWPPKKSPSCFQAATSAEPCGADNPCRT